MYQHPDKMRARASGLVSRTGYAAGGHKLGPTADSDFAQDVNMITKAVHQHESAMHPGKPKTRIKLASGGMTEGRMDRSPRRHPGSQVNVVITPPAHPPGPMGGGMMPPMRPPMPVAAPPMPPRPAGPPPGAAMPPGGGGLPMGAPMGGGMPPGAAGMAPRPFKDGGNIGKAGAGSPEMTAGSGSGRGRLEKVARQGLSPKGR